MRIPEGVNISQTKAFKDYDQNDIQFNEDESHENTPHVTKVMVSYGEYNHPRCQCECESAVCNVSFAGI